MAFPIPLEQIASDLDLRQHISQLRQITSTYSTRPDLPGGSSALAPPGMIFSESTPPLETSNHLKLWYHYVKRRGQSRGLIPPKLPTFSDTSPLVMTDADLDLGNIMLDESGHVWLIDCGASGFFPRGTNKLQRPGLLVL